MTAIADTPTTRTDAGAPTALAQVMAERGLHGDEVAAAARVNPATLHKWSSGRARPRGPAAERLAATLGEPAERLFPHLADRTPLRAELDRQGLSVRDLARRIGTHENSVYSWVTGHYNPQPELAQRAAAVLDHPAADLFPDIAARLHQVRAAPSQPGQPAEQAKPSRLAAALAERGMTATALARAVNVTLSTVGKWADGAAPTVEHAEGAAAALGVEVAEVFDRVHLGHRGGRGGRLELPLVPGAPTVDQILDTPPTGDDRWAERAACADPDLDPDAWWPSSAADPAERARRVCGGCSVLGDCRQAFLDDPNTRRQGADGIWAGLPGRVLLTLTRNPNRDGGRDQAAHRPAAPAKRAVVPADVRRRAGRRLAALMDAQGLTGDQLAADLGVSRDAVAQWRQGHRTPGGDLAERLAHRLGVDPDRLWPDRDHSRDGITR